MNEYYTTIVSFREQQNKLKYVWKLYYIARNLKELTRVNIWLSVIIEICYQSYICSVVSMHFRNSVVFFVV